jgi:hypothetical protein
MTARRNQGKRKRGDNGRAAQAQVPNYDNDAPAPVHVPIFPKLTSLSLDLLAFSTIVPGTGVLFNLVLNAIQRHKVNKTPLTTQRLCIENCVIREKQANALATREGSL